ncbi:hypothetical protein NC653_023734 [Populus alba x Populus x berolinensis]|uniref:Pentatricopeptide repeat-containing protein n=4 Tax=Populus TaxID=3689 RepID=A0A4U5MAV0_POPAL|nr:hypothetical protein NC653_023734 [Populus alba x Populus x berolinensis]TKR66134.1 hypothetical protein D5086_0000313760 [Populus alba]
MYLKNESVEEGRRAFDEMGERNVVSWTSLLTGHAQNGLNVETMDLLLRMEFKMVIKNGFGAATFACNALINMNFESRKIRDGRGVFDGLKDKECWLVLDQMTLPILKSQPGVSPFVIHAQAIKSSHAKSPSVGNALLNAYVKRGNVDEASKVFQSTDEKDVAWSALISGYAQIGDTDGAIRIFVQMEKKGN